MKISIYWILENIAERKLLKDVKKGISVFHEHMYHAHESEGNIF